MEPLTRDEINELRDGTKPWNLPRALFTLTLQADLLESLQQDRLLPFGQAAINLLAHLKEPANFAAVIEEAHADADFRSMVEGLYRIFRLMDATLTAAAWQPPTPDRR